MASINDTAKLFCFNQRVTALFNVVFLPFACWIVVNVFAHTAAIAEIQKSESTENHATPESVAALRSDIAAIIATLPPAEWKKRIVGLEENRNVEAITLAKIETTLEDIKDRVIALDDLHRKNKQANANTP